MKNISSITKKYCYGCSACFSVCHVSAITMVENEEGFLQPKVNEEKCINCGRCLKTCPAENRWTGFTELSDFFGYRNNDLDVILSSTSGGMFSVVVKLFPNANVVGAVYKDGEICHVLTKEATLIKKMRGSKYVQSNMRSVFSEIKDKLQNSEEVIFCGTS